MKINRKIGLLIIGLTALSAAIIYKVYFNPEFLEKQEITPLTKPWEFAIPNQKTPAGLVNLSAENCGACHTEYYAEWKTSTHAHAWSDMQFQAELKKESSPFMCINCHIPLQNQQEFIVKGLINGDIYRPVKEKNPHFDKSLQQEAITCATCHVRDGFVIGSKGNTQAPHPVKKDPEFLSESLCISCHNANAVLTPTLACTFQTGDEWKAGPFYGKKNCISCHMPETHRELVAGYGEKLGHFHGFPGSGIPKFDTVKANALQGLSFSESKIPASLGLGKKLNYTLSLKNEFAGHRLPTGDPERFYLIRIKLLNEAGNVVSEKNYRIGEQWEWYPEAKKISDNNLNPGETRNFEFSWPTKNPGKYTLQAEVTKHRLSQESADYNKLGKNYPLFISVFKKEYPVWVLI